MNSSFGAEVNPSGSSRGGLATEASWGMLGGGEGKTRGGKIGAPPRTLRATSGVFSRREKRQQQGFR